MRLQTKILAGYLVLVAVICSMAAILVHERGRMREIEAETGEIQEIRRDITVAQRNIITLATLGEGVIGWEEADYRHYRTRRLRTDSLLQAMKPRCKDFVHPAQIDTLRALLVEKEAHLLHLMETFARQDKADSLLVNHLPEVAKRATRVRTVTQKKKGIAGAFGGKKTVQILPSAKELHQFSDSLIAMQQERTVEMEAYTDSLRTLGRRLNAELLLNDTEADNRMRHAQTIGDAAGRMAGMINNLLVYFRLDSGKETPSVKPFKLRSITETLETEFATLAKNKGLNFKTESERL